MGRDETIGKVPTDGGVHAKDWYGIPSTVR